ncbi:MAG: transporter substrate-binding domain-containing protein [Hyphomicrobiales bacterium]|nr:transporter substrate-binding domain-containing protein [Hyphomicrobiales bacterium]
MRSNLRLLLAAASLSAFAAFSSAHAKPILFGMEGAFPPWNLTDSSGNIIGFEVDLMNDICARAKLECKAVAQDWDGMIPALEAGKIDVISDDMSITEERMKRISFSDPYAVVPMSLMSTKDSPLASMAENGKKFDLAASTSENDAMIAHFKEVMKGKSIGVQSSTTMANFLSQTLKDIATISEYKTIDQRNLDLQAGRLDVIMDDYTVLTDMAKKPDMKDYVVAGPRLTGGEFFGIGAGFGIRKSDDELRLKINEALTAAFADGSAKKYMVKWFGVDVSP